jgi:glycosyltransferase involved in cell wall biosynthesis
LPDWVQLLHEPKPGSYAARNKGAAVAKGEILAFTDSDCVPHKKWLSNAAMLFKKTNCDLLGGRVKIFKPENGGKYGYLYERLTAFPQHKNVPLGKGVTANLFVKKTVFEKNDGFDSKIKSGGDWEFTERCTETGHQMIYGEEALVYHPSRDLPIILKKDFRLTCGGVLNVREKYGHSYLRMLGSHLLRGLIVKRNFKESTGGGERLIVFCVDLLKYFYRTAIYGGMLLRLIDPNKVRE